MISKLSVTSQVSPPLVAFRETILDPHEVPDRTPTPQTVFEALTPTGLCCFRVRASPLPEKATSILDDSKEVLGYVFEQQEDRGIELQEIGKRLQSVLEDGPPNAKEIFQVRNEYFEGVSSAANWGKVALKYDNHCGPLLCLYVFL